MCFPLLLLLGAVFAQSQFIQPWLTTCDKAHLLESQPKIFFSTTPSPCSTPSDCILVNDSQLYQEIDGFGAAMTESSAYVLLELPEDAFKRALLALFDPLEGIGINFVRVPMGTCDFALSDYTYDDTKDDYSLSAFSIANDRRYILPVLQKALEIRKTFVRPEEGVLPLYIMGSPWSPPAWLKTSDQLGWGTLLASTQATDTFASYFARFVAAYQEILATPIYAVTLQNEPLFEPKTYAGMHLDARREAELAVRTAAKFRTAKFSTKIAAYDHNWDNASYPLELLANQEARAAVAGTAWHCYAGDVSAQGYVHDRYPGKETYLTECSGGQWAPNFGDNLLWDVETLIIGGTRNWARAVLKWNLALDQHYGPTHHGCLNCRPFITVDTSTTPPSYRFESEYYAIGHASKFVRAGARRIDSTLHGRTIITPCAASARDLKHVAFLNPRDRTIVMLVTNPTQSLITFELAYRTNSASIVIPGRSVMTLVWPSM